MDFLKKYEADIKAFIEALVEFIKTIVAKLTAGEESAE